MNCNYYNFSSNIPPDGCITGFNYLYKNNIVASSPSSPIWKWRYGATLNQFCPIFYFSFIHEINKQMKYNNFINLSMCSDGGIQNTDSICQNFNG